jgi:hypothetical protein
LHPLIRTVPHPAFKVADLREAIQGEELLLGPYEPIDGYHVAIIRDGGIPIELIQTELSDDEIWDRAKAGQGSLYRNEPIIPAIDQKGQSGSEMVPAGS